jgi:hypothetical protein
MEHFRSEAQCPAHPQHPVQQTMIINDHVQQTPPTDCGSPFMVAVTAFRCHKCYAYKGNMINMNYECYDKERTQM